MNAETNTGWQEANQRWLTQALKVLGETLNAHKAASDAYPLTEASPTKAQAVLDELAADMSSPPALEVLSETFGLTSFEQNILLLCAGIELDGELAKHCTTAQGQDHPMPATFGFALEVFSEANWSALAPNAPLRRWRLIEINTTGSLTSTPLHIDERVLHYLTGVSYLDPRLESLLEALTVDYELVSSQHRLVENISAAWSETSDNSVLPVVQLLGQDAEATLSIAANACVMLGLSAYRLDVAFLPTLAKELDELSHLWAREAALINSVLILDCLDVEATDTVHRGAVKRFVETTRAALMLTTRTREFSLRRASLALDVLPLTRNEQHTLWQNALGSELGKINGKCNDLVSQFNLGVSAIHAATHEALERESSGREDPNGKELIANLWTACRTQARPALANLAQVIETRATWEDLVLPVSKIEILQQIAMQVRHRYKVYQQWGFAAKSARGLGISALFTGPSGTGKTMAAEVLANELNLDLYRIDLSSVVSKYIGETEKNLRRIFDAAEAGGAILLFDEADALFGKRSEVKDSHDRYANVEISYLLQRMEDFGGLAILTSNLKTALDTAFQRRIRFIVQFQFPDQQQRAEIWQNSFPQHTPREALDVNKLAQLNVAGGHIRNIAMNAAFCAADDLDSVRMKHLLGAARSEFVKMEKTLTATEIQGWLE